MNASPALAKIGPTASTSCEPAGPIDATAFDATIASVFETATDGVSCVSSWASVMLVWFAALSLATASSAKCYCSSPSAATGPVNGPSIAMFAVQLPLLAEVEAEPDALVLVVLLLLLLPQPTTTSVESSSAALMNLLIF